MSNVRDRDYVVITEKKTGKIRRIYFSPAIRDFLQDYIQDMADGDYLFPSQVGENKPLTRGQAYNIIAEAAEAVGLQNIGTHSLRKSFGYHHYQKFKDVAILQEIFNHSAPSVTLRYIGINDDVIKGTMQDFVLWIHRYRISMG